jgi:anti-anti-sigma factor
MISLCEHGCDAKCARHAVNTTYFRTVMTDSRPLHEAQIAGRGVEPAGVFTIESLPAHDGVATPSVRTHLDAAAGRRALVLDLAEVTFVDSSMLKELLRAANDLDRYETRLVLAGVPPAVQRLLDLTRTTELFTMAPDCSAALALVA